MSSIKFTINFNSPDATDEGSLDVTIESDNNKSMTASVSLYHEWKIGKSNLMAPIF
jgi:hypothetical protein